MITIMRTTDVEIADRSSVEYVGRCSTGWLKKSPLANRRRRANEKPGDTLPDYRRWLWAESQKEGPVRRELIRLVRKYRAERRLVLVCHCEDETKCHASVIRSFISWASAEMDKPKPKVNRPVKATGAQWLAHLAGC